jgi:histidinol-phosphate aminotransferase
MKNQFRKTLDSISQYKPGTSIEEVKKLYNLEKVVKLASNENPYGCPVSLDDLKSALDQSVYYPDPFNHPLYENLAKFNGISTDQLVLGNGSDNVLEMIALSFVNDGDEVISSAHSFSVYKHVTQLMNGVYREVPMKNYTVDLEAISKQVSSKTKVVFIANPNNPTGTACTSDQLSSFLESVPDTVIVVIDQAYIEFSDPEYHIDTKSFISKFPNVVITKTFSKAYGLAGFRIGYGMASKDIIDLFHKVRAPFNVNQMALYAADIALTKTEFISETTVSNRKEKTFLKEALGRLNVTVLPSQANFLCCFTEGPSRDIYTSLIQKGIIIRSLESFGLPNAIRVSIGKNADNELFLEAYRAK